MNNTVITINLGCLSKDQERTLTAKVVSERWYTVNGVEIDEKTGQDITAGASATTKVDAGIFEAQVEVHGSYTWKRSDGKKFRAESKKVFDKFVAGPSKGQYKSLYTHGLGNGAELDFIFDGHSGGNSVSWAPSGSGSGQGSGGD